ncbi:kinase-like protein [Gigaspora margarita]|uniref:Kinase-like protein n=1 Tax=Gigaspora margarita TaxID=4874 RepID=A0A8H4AT68_GIGMA|nr:kinase-like protein [Gigaspora margarita]
MEDGKEYIGRLAISVYPQWKTESEDDGNDTFVLMHIDFHTSNFLVKNDEITGIIDWECSGAFPVECLCTYPVWITNNPMIEQTNKKSRENIKLQKIF